jgi:hypothetical protein
MRSREMGVSGRLRPSSLAGVAVIGAALGSAWDLLHVRTHTTIYASGIGRMPWWVPFEFAAVYVAGVAGIALFGSPTPDARSRERLVAEAAWVTIVYAMTAALHRHELLVAGIALAALLARQTPIRAVVRANPIPAAALIVAGSTVEAILIAAGVFRYTYASLGNIPLWLPLLYANAVPFAIRLAEAALARRVHGSEAVA